ncbi:MAG: hypothetical protein ACOYD9_04000 [Pyramidobacter sp.]|jgi:hypothetical protein
MRRSRGMTVAGILVSLPLMLVVSWAAVQVSSFCTECFERTQSCCTDASWQSAERLLAFLDNAVKHCGVGLPERWESDLFSPPAALNSMPPWSLWKKAAVAGNAVSGKGFVSSGIGWGNTLRILSAVPTGQVVVQPFQLEKGAAARLHLSAPVKSESSVKIFSSASWLLFPGTEVPLRFSRDALSDRPVVTARDHVDIPWGTPACRLQALVIYALGGRVYADFCDSSGAQPLFNGIEGVLFKVSPEKLLSVKVSLKSPRPNGIMEVCRTWKIGL